MPKAILEGSITGVWSYLLALDWEEPWLWMLMGFHVFCLSLTSLSLCIRSYNFQATLFVIYLSIAYCSEYINEWAAHNYKLFSEEQYFDSNGMFISILLSTPLLLNCFIMVGAWLWEVTQTLIGLQRAKLRHKAKELKAQEAKKDE